MAVCALGGGPRAGGTVGGSAHSGSSAAGAEWAAMGRRGLPGEGVSQGCCGCCGECCSVGEGAAGGRQGPHPSPPLPRVPPSSSVESKGSVDTHGLEREAVAWPSQAPAAPGT